MIQNRVCLCFLTSSIYHLAYQTNNLKNIESPINLWLNICMNLQVYRMQCDDMCIYIYIVMYPYKIFDVLVLSGDDVDNKAKQVRQRGFLQKIVHGLFG